MAQNLGFSHPEDPDSPPEDAGFAMIPRWLARDGSISAAAKAVYVNLSSRIGYEGTCWPSQGRIAEETGYSDRTVRTAIAELEEIGVVEVFTTTTPTGRRNTYLVHNGRGPETGPGPRGVRKSTSGGVRKPASGEVETVEVEPLEEEHSTAVAVKADRPEVDALCEMLADAVKANGFKRPKTTKAAHDAMRLLLDADGYTVEQVKWMIGFATRHHFWYKNIRSASKLREQFDRLKVEAKEQAGKGGPARPHSAPLPTVDELDEPPADGTPEEISAWYREYDAKKRALSPSLT